MWGREPGDLLLGTAGRPYGPPRAQTGLTPATEPASALAPRQETPCRDLNQDPAAHLRPPPRDVPPELGQRRGETGEERGVRGREGGVPEELPGGRAHHGRPGLPNAAHAPAPSGAQGERSPARGRVGCRSRAGLRPNASPGSPRVGAAARTPPPLGGPSPRGRGFRPRLSRRATSPRRHFSFRAEGARNCSCRGSPSARLAGILSLGLCGSGQGVGTAWTRGL